MLPAGRRIDSAYLGCCADRRDDKLGTIATGMELKHSPNAVTDALVAKDLEVIAIDEDHIKGAAFNLAFLVWRRRTLAAAYRAGIELVSSLALKNPSGVGVMQVVETDAVPPDAEARKAFNDFMKQTSIKHYSVTHEGTGFKAASVRAIVSGVQAMARPNFEHSVHSTVADASRWAAAQNRRIGRNDEWSAIERLMQTLRRIHLEKYPRESR